MDPATRRADDVSYAEMMQRDAFSTRLIEASLLGGALGDSLGAEIEFWDLAQIRSRYPDGPTELIPHQGVRGAITDDTQMTLFTAEGLIRAHVRGTLRGIVSVEGTVHHALLRWLLTQGEAVAIDFPIDRTQGLVADVRLRHRRAPGNTCLAALRSARDFATPARNNSKGCGTIMRVAPVAFAAPRELVRRLAIETSALTHGHPTGQLAAAAWAELLADVAAGADVATRAELLANEYAMLDGGTETADAIRSALDAPRDGQPETVEMLGGGWTADEALAIGLYAALATKDFEGGLRCAVTHSGDSDSTGAIAGTLLGLIYPDQTLQHSWGKVVECRDLIATIAADLAAAPTWDQSDAEAVFVRYPGW